MNELIENLASRKTFSELSEAEREIVLADMSREAYEHLRAVLLAAPALDAGPPPPAALRARLLARMGAARPPAISRVLALRIPVWQAAAILTLAVAAAWFLKTPAIREVAVPVVRIQTDTFFREKVVWRERVVFREKSAPKERPEVAVSLPLILTGREPDTLVIPAGTFAQPPVGTSLQDEPALMDFFVGTK